MPQEELDLFDFAARGMAQLRTSPTQIVWSDVIQLCSFGTPPNDVPDDVLGNAFTPRRSVSADGPEDPALANLGRHYPAIDRLLNDFARRRFPALLAHARGLHAVDMHKVEQPSGSRHAVQ